MRFSTIAITKKGVTTVRASKDDGGEEEVVSKRREKPLSSFSDALQAFKAYVLQLFDGAVTIDEAKINVTTLNFSFDKNGLLGMIVTAIVPVPKAYGKPLVLNTPLVREGGENTSADAFVLSDEVMDMIALVQDEATRYLNGEREQLELGVTEAKQETSENTKAFNERAAAAEAATSRNPKTRGAKKKHSSTADAEAAATTWNPDKTEPLTTTRLRQLLMTVERDVPEDAITAWTSSERDAAQRWAEARQKEIIGELKTDRMPREPECVLKSATMPLSEAWVDPKPPRPDAKGIEAIKAEANRAPLHVH